MMPEDLPEFIETHQVDIAALTLPKENAEAVAAKLVSYGIKAFWNFAHVDLDVPDDVVVENVVDQNGLGFDAGLLMISGGNCRTVTLWAVVVDCTNTFVGDVR